MLEGCTVTDCCDVEELAEWAKREKLGARFQSGLEEVVKQGGLHTVTDTFLSGLGIMLPGMRKKILDSIKRKLVGNKKVRFGEIMKYDPILNKKPSTKCPWVEIDEIEVRHDKETWQAAIRTWRFCTTGLDGLEEISLLRKAFDTWRPKPKGFLRMLQEMLEGIGAFFTSMPCCCREKALE
ncbi:unnamed protein product [Cladocopium goreaui]|uniref:Uncharacterized protein n=1 Tax=Cladocopium goreaui TaxID=2562237 RepID=A0A9P1G2G7_9DINO|nr:unnamed protein product [Cladocopium goreaui]